MTELITVYLGLGSNLGAREDNLDRALELLKQRMQLGKISSIFETEPIGNVNQPRFLNMACQTFTRLAPEGLLALAKGIESKMGRHGKSGEPRIIDIDILLYGDRVIETPELTVPHPAMEQRAFVLVPLAEIAPALVHPVTGKTIKEIVDKGGWDLFRREEKTAIRALSSLDETVIAVGGGAVMDAENRESLRRNGLFLWLTADVPTIIERMRNDRTGEERMPPLASDSAERETAGILKQRTPIYRGLADFTIDTASSSLLLSIALEMYSKASARS